MSIKSLNAKGFAPLLLLVGVAAVLVVGGSGAYVYHKNHKPKAAATTNASAKTPTQTDKSSTTSGATLATPNPYAGWNTYTLAGTGGTFKYPSTWAVTDEGVSCGSDHTYEVTAPSSEVQQSGLTPIAHGETLESYFIGVMSGCTTPGTDNTGTNVGSEANSQAISSGLLQGKYLLVNGDTDGTTSVGVFSKNYTSGQKITESGVLALGGTNYELNATLSAGQDTANVNTQAFVSSQLYKDTLSILNSFTAAN
jgi:hypothetical protein